MPIAVPDENLLGFLSPVEGFPSQNLTDAIAGALEYRAHEQSLLDAAEKGKKVVIAFNAKSASSTSFSYLLAKELLGKGATSISLLEGAPDPTQPRPSRAIPEKTLDIPAQLIRHDRKTSEVVKIGEVEGGGEVLVSQAFAAADIRCVVTNVAVNAFWGYSGGPSLIVAGLTSENTIRRCLSPTLRSTRLPGVLAGNPAYEALIRVCHMVHVDVGVHIVEAPDGSVVGAFSGDPMQTFEQACSLTEKIFRPQLHRKADIVISSAGGVPWDRTLCEASLCAMTAATACKDHGVLVLVAECADGIGEFPSTGLRSRDSKGQTSHSRKGFTLQRMLEYSFEKLCGEHRVYLVSTLPEHHASLCGLLAARSVRNAFERAVRHAGKDAAVALISYGCLTAPLVG